MTIMEPQDHYEAKVDHFRVTAYQEAGFDTAVVFIDNEGEDPLPASSARRLAEEIMLAADAAERASWEPRIDSEVKDSRGNVGRVSALNNVTPSRVEVAVVWSDGSRTWAPLESLRPYSPPAG